MTSLSRKPCSGAQELPDIVATLHQGGLTGLQISFEGAVFYFHHHRALVLYICQSREKFVPIHITQAGKLGCVKLERCRHDSHLIEMIPIHTGIFKVHVKDTLFKLIDGSDVIDLLPHEVRGIVV